MGIMVERMGLEQREYQDKGLVLLTILDQFLQVGIVTVYESVDDRLEGKGSISGPVVEIYNCISIFPL